MKHYLTTIPLIMFLISCIVGNLPAQQTPPLKVWRELSETGVRNRGEGSIRPVRYRAFLLDYKGLKQVLDNAPVEFGNETRRKAVVILLPQPDGGFDRFRIHQSPIMSPELAARFPEIKSYSGQGLDDKTASLRITFSPQGFHAFVITKNTSFMVSPQRTDGEPYYLSYFTRDAGGMEYDCVSPFNTGNTRNGLSFEKSLRDETNSFVISGNNLRIYRFSFAVTQQFYQRFGGPFISPQNDLGVTAAISAYLNNLSAIYEREISSRFILQSWVADRPGYCSQFSNCFPPSQVPTQMLQGNQFILDNVFPGSSGYDVGFALGYDGLQPLPGGFASFGSQGLGGACENSFKGQSATRLTGTAGDYLGTVILSHELGHMFGARHTFSTGLGSCSGAAEPTNMFEPGSGSTIMSYAPACGTDNLASAPDSNFHIDSLLRIANHKAVYPATSCGQSVSNGNSPPVITNGGTDATIPAFTPFVLSAGATDSNGDTLSYDWEEYDPGTRLFRSYVPMSSPSRVFPNLLYVRFYGNSPPTYNPFASEQFLTGEILPFSTRTLNFTVTVRDNRSGGGGTTARDTLLAVNVVGNAGPFAVTQPNTNIAWGGGTQQIITWSVAGTNLPPINTSNVRILLSTDDGQTFPTILSNSTPNDGSEVITLPNLQASQARIRVEAVGNIYFDISNTSFTISQGVNVQTTIQSNPIGRSFTVDGVSYSSTQIFNWISGSSHVINTTSPQNGPSGTRYVWSSWSDGGTISHAISPTTNTTYTANFVTQYQLTMTAGVGGTVTPQSANWYNSGQSVQIFAVPNGGFAFGSWLGTGTGSYSGIVNSQSIVLNGPITETATFSSLPNVRKPFDYDGDGRADLSVRRPSDNIWYILRGFAGYFNIEFGVVGDLIAPADYDGDGKTDVAVFRPSNGTWYTFNSQSQSFTTTGWGANGDLPVPADHDGDGRADLVVFRPSTNTWYTRFANGTFSTTVFGVAGDKPVVGDFDGDGKADIALYRPSDNNWYILKTGFGFFVQTWGVAGDIPVPADYDGDGKTDVSVFRPSTGQWFRIQSTAGFDTVNWGVNGDQPIPADYDGDGKSDVAVFRPSNATWYIVGSTSGQLIQNYGVAGDLPTEGAFIY